MSTIWKNKAIYRMMIHHHHHNQTISHNISHFCHFMYILSSITDVMYIILIYCEETEENEEKIKKEKDPHSGNDTNMWYPIYSSRSCMLMVHHSIHSKLRVASLMSHSRSLIFHPQTGRNIVIIAPNTESRSLASKQVFFCLPCFRFGKPWKTLWTS